MDRILNTIKYRIKWHMAQFPSKSGRLIQVNGNKERQTWDFYWVVAAVAV